MRILPYGQRAMLLDELDRAPAVLCSILRTGFTASGLRGVIDVVPAARTVLITVGEGVALTTVEASVLALASAHAETASIDPPRPVIVELEVRYDGPDLDDVAAITGLPVDQVVSLHSAPTYRVAFCGFAPGFAYLEGLDPRLIVPRRGDPRPRVPAGSVAIAARYAAVYPRQSPGGWRLLGTTTASLFDERRVPPALLEPGATVRFIPT